MRLIDADALHKALFAKQKWVVHCGDKYNEGYTSDQVHFTIDEMPTVDPIKHGHWINKGFEPTRCSVCGITVDAINEIPWAIKSFKYCPYCGARMDEVEDGKAD